MITLICVFALEKITFAAGYIPNIQFAPFYIAEERGYYREEGLEIEFDYTLGPDILKLVALNKIQVGSVDPDAFLIAEQRELPLIHIATLYQKYPITLISKTEFRNKEDLKGKSIGISGTYGASYLGLKAILNQFELTLGDIQIRSIGYNQVSSLQQGKVDAVIGYLNHEPVILENQGVKVFNLRLRKESQLPGVGIMASKEFKKNHPDQVNGFLKATFRGVSDVLSDPESCFQEVMKNYLAHLDNDQHLATTREVLSKTLPFLESQWSRENGLGQCSPDMWGNLEQLMIEEGLLPKEHDWSKKIDRSFLLKPIPLEK